MQRGLGKRHHLRTQLLAFQSLEQFIEVQVQRMKSGIGCQEIRLAGAAGRLGTDITELRLLAVQHDEAVLGQEGLLRRRQAVQDVRIG